ncbi:GL27225 [Drosophila persimilis]|uniref:Integrator complex subunit 12 n=1 Tax=Drosophila persimilis TaxID=7234 RepID=B4GYW6_DROPE|nr:GL27225 [Drosophila persimilis]
MAANIAAAVAVPQEVDPVLKKAIKLLHSSNSTSASELRLLLDEALRARYGPEKSVTQNMTQRMMDDEMSFPGRAPTPPQPINTDEIINLTNSPDKDPSDSVDTIIDSDECLSAAGIVNTGDTGDFGDLNCCVCGEMMFTATNRLVECSKCGAMYHQECHKPPITKEEAADDQEQTWQCDTCCNKPTSSRSVATAAAAAATLPPTSLSPTIPCRWPPADEQNRIGRILTILDILQLILILLQARAEQLYQCEQQQQQQTRPQVVIIVLLQVAQRGACQQVGGSLIDCHQWCGEA